MPNNLNFTQLAKNEGFDLVILAGGAATRLAPLGLNKPKSMLCINEMPFLYWQIEALRHALPAIRRALVVIRAGDEPVFAPLVACSPIPLSLMPEKTPRGTGGALLDAANLADISTLFLAINGDVLFSSTPKQLLQTALKVGCAMQALEVPDAYGLGLLKSENNMLTAFERANTHISGTINAGLYAFQSSLLQNYAASMPHCDFISFENEIAHTLIKQKQIGLVTTQSPFIDIGTPAAYGAAEFYCTDFRRKYLPHLKVDKLKKAAVVSR